MFESMAHFDIVHVPYEALASEGADPGGSSPDEFALYIRTEKERLGKLIRSAKIPMQ